MSTVTAPDMRTIRGRIHHLLIHRWEGNRAQMAKQLGVSSQLLRDIVRGKAVPATQIDVVVRALCQHEFVNPAWLKEGGSAHDWRPRSAVQPEPAADVEPEATTIPLGPRAGRVAYVLATCYEGNVASMSEATAQPTTLLESILAGKLHPADEVLEAILAADGCKLNMDWLINGEGPPFDEDTTGVVAMIEECEVTTIEDATAADEPPHPLQVLFDAVMKPYQETITAVDNAAGAAIEEVDGKIESLRAEISAQICKLEASLSGVSTQTTPATAIEQAKQAVTAASELQTEVAGLRNLIEDLKKGQQAYRDQVAIEVKKLADSIPVGESVRRMAIAAVEELGLKASYDAAIERIAAFEASQTQAVADLKNIDFNAVAASIGVLGRLAVRIDSIEHRLAVASGTSPRPSPVEPPAETKPEAAIDPDMLMTVAEWNSFVGDHNAYLADKQSRVLLGKMLSSAYAQNNIPVEFALDAGRSGRYRVRDLRHYIRWLSQVSGKPHIIHWVEYFNRVALPAHGDRPEVAPAPQGR